MKISEVPTAITPIHSVLAFDRESAVDVAIEEASDMSVASVSVALARSSIAAAATTAAAAAAVVVAAVPAVLLDNTRGLLMAKTRKQRSKALCSTGRIRDSIVSDAFTI